MGTRSSAGYIGWAKQASKGTGVAPSFFGRFLTVSPNPENEIEDFREGGSGIQGRYAEKVGMIFPFSASFNMRSNLAGWLLTMILGADSVSGTGPYDHAITVLDPMNWHSIEAQILGDLTPNELVNRFIDAKMNTLVVAGAAGGFATMAPEWQALDLDSSGAAATPSYLTDDILKFLHGTFNVFGGATVEMTEFTLTITRNLEATQTNSLTYQQLEGLGLDIGLDFTLKVTQDDEFRKVYFGGASGTEPDEALEASQVTLTFNNGAAGADEREVVITIPELSYLAAPITDLNADPEVNFYACSGIATKAAGSDLISADVKSNDSAEYDA